MCSHRKWFSVIGFTECLTSCIGYFAETDRQKEEVPTPFVSKCMLYLCELIVWSCFQKGRHLARWQPRYSICWPMTTPKVSSTWCAAINPGVAIFTIMIIEQICRMTIISKRSSHHLIEFPDIPRSPSRQSRVHAHYAWQSTCNWKEGYGHQHQSRGAASAICRDWCVENVQNPPRRSRGCDDSGCQGPHRLSHHWSRDSRFPLGRSQVPDLQGAAGIVQGHTGLRRENEECSTICKKGCVEVVTELGKPYTRLLCPYKAAPWALPLLNDEGLFAICYPRPTKWYFDSAERRIRSFVFLFLPERLGRRIHVVLFQNSRRTNSSNTAPECPGEQLYCTCVQPWRRRAISRYVPHLASVCWWDIGWPEVSAGVIITDQEYPVRPAFSLLTKVLDDFASKVPQSSYSNPSAISFPEINTYIQKYQDPRQADAIMKVQQELDETKIVLVCRLFFRLRSVRCYWGYNSAA